jgi:hypothetical protein
MNGHLGYQLPVARSQLPLRKLLVLMKRERRLIAAVDAGAFYGARSRH